MEAAGYSITVIDVHYATRDIIYQKTVILVVAAVGYVA
jgi:hypothetical protein